MTTQTTDPTDGMADEQLADYYDQTHDLSEFDLAAPEPVIPARQRLDVSITVRFTPDEIDALRATADPQGVKVTTLIRSLAVQHQPGGQVVDVVGARRVLSTMVRELSEKLGGGASVSVTVGPGQSKKRTKPARKNATATKKVTPTKKATPAKSTTKASTAKKAVTTTTTTPAKKATPARSSDYGLAASARRKSTGGSRTARTRGTE